MGKVMQGIKLKNGEFKKDKDGKYIEIEVEEPSYLYQKEVIEKIGEKNWNAFSKWMNGQGCPLMSDGSIGYFSWDVEKFYNRYVLGIPPLTKKEIFDIIQKEDRIKWED